MEYLQFGFAAVFCLMLYKDQRTVLKELRKSIDVLSVSISEIAKYVCKKDS